MKYFVISDVHGHFDVLKKTLIESGFDVSNKSHHLLILGDLFDRGTQSKQVLEYVYNLSQANKATVILGNHDSYLMEFIEEDYIRSHFNIVHNGFGETLKSLSNLEPTLNNFAEIRKIIIQQYPYLYDWLSSFPLYIEIDEYVFVHGGIDGSKEWKNLSRKDYMWTKEVECPPIQNKTVVAGHQRVATIRYPKANYVNLFREHPEAFDILYLPGKILIDRFVEISKEINVLIIDLEG